LLPAAETVDDLRFQIHPKNHDLTLQFTCGGCGQAVVCIGVCLDHSRFSGYTGAELIRFKDGQTSKQSKDENSTLLNYAKKKMEEVGLQTKVRKLPKYWVRVIFKR
jgi:anthranilate/para-aminobenzoate synthase component II